MKKRLNGLWKSGKETAASQAGLALEHICIGPFGNCWSDVLRMQLQSE